ncbi:MAG: Golgi transport complex subunit 3 [Chaenotheca gracillima]|nr:MAG: Golgi transport complex subunit 3 [Chaenotheca gracillima]
MAASASTSNPSTASGPSASRYSYYPQSSPLGASQVPSGSLQYQSGYPQQAQRPQTFPTYESNMMFNQGPQQQPQAAMYHNLPQSYVQAPYQPQRYTGSMEGLPESLSDVSQSYVQRDLPSGSAAPVASHENPSPYATLSYPPQQPSTNKKDVPTSFSSGMSDLPSSGTQDPVPQDGPERGLEAALEDYQRELRRIFTSVRDGHLVEAGQTLLQITSWFLSHVPAMGLGKDDENRYHERIKLWHDFNHGWLTTFQKQKDLSLAILASGQRLPATQTLMTKPLIERLADELIKQCDDLERRGLVDYEMGVWEEDIMRMVQKCVDLMEGDNSAAFLELSGHMESASTGQR